MNRIEKWFSLIALISLVIATLQIAWFLKFWIMPLACLGFAFFSYLWRKDLSIWLFFFFLPLINSLPDLQFNGYPYNYMGLALFYFSGLVLASFYRREKHVFHSGWKRVYFLYLIIVSLSVLFVFLRWSNITLSFRALMADTPVTPSGKQVSFASIFPVLSLFFIAMPPFLPSILKINGWNLERSIRPIMTGFIISLAIGFFQRFFYSDFLTQEWWKRLRQYNGGFSDFNSFGFFSGVLFFLLLIRLIKQPERVWMKLGLFIFPLAGVILSGSRMAFLFIMVGGVYIALTRNIKLFYKAVALFLLAVVIFVFGGRLKERLQVSVQGTGGIVASGKTYQALDQLSTGRLELIKETLPIIPRFPLTGVGVGNYLFFLDYLAFPNPAINELALNHFLLVQCESGLIGLIFFLFFLWAIWRHLPGWDLKILLGAMLVSLNFNVYLWFPECLLLFWLVVSTLPDSNNQVCMPFFKRRWVQLALIALFSFFQVYHFSSLHPANLCQSKGAGYSYGLWYGEESGGVPFHWSKAASGVYFHEGEKQTLRIVSAAPISILYGKKQVVDLYWRGKHARRWIFYKPGEREFSIPSGRKGFLEIRVNPVFNPKNMGLNEDDRYLGVQVFTLTGEPGN